MKYEHSAKDKAKLNIKHYINLKLQSESEHMVLGRLEAITRAIIEDIPEAAEWVNNRYSFTK